jgi:hypothetical protein
MNRKILKPNSGSFFKPGGRNGCLLLYSSTRSPSSMKPLVDHLSTQGYLFSVGYSLPFSMNTISVMERWQRALFLL